MEPTYVRSKCVGTARNIFGHWPFLNTNSGCCVEASYTIERVLQTHSILSSDDSTKVEFFPPLFLRLLLVGTHTAYNFLEESCTALENHTASHVQQKRKFSSLKKGIVCCYATIFLWGSNYYQMVVFVWIQNLSRRFKVQTLTDSTVIGCFTFLHFLRNQSGTAVCVSSLVFQLFINIPFLTVKNIPK